MQKFTTRNKHDFVSYIRVRRRTLGIVQHRAKQVANRMYKAINR